MGFNKVSLITLMLLLFLTVSAVNASAVQLDNDALVLDESNDDSLSLHDESDDNALIEESENLEYSKFNSTKNISFIGGAYFLKNRVIKK